MLGAGYLPAAAQGRMAEWMMRRLSQLPAFFAAGGNLIVFPEGTRSRTGLIGPFNSGAFKIARMCRAPLAVLRVRHTDRLFRPDRFRFNTCAPNTITLELAACLRPDYSSPRFSIKGLMEQVRRIYQAGGDMAKMQDGGVK
jgi:1-acyl-sn-glycerol-3-phosphate acyltransferase